ncbi:MAG: transposase [Candidatus Parcubacteria bacterium]|nr:transposase [Candidatus Parcubacteria bacterium]
MNREPFALGEFYHVYNHGVDDRHIFVDEHDSMRFLESLIYFNTEESFGGIYLGSLPDAPELKGKKPQKKLVNVVSYCLNPNHFHLLLEQVSEKGISEFMQRVGGGYTMYFNNKYKRKGSLFRGTFKSSWINSNEYLLYLSAYINLNFCVHKLSEESLKVVRSSWDEYVGQTRNKICSKDIVMGQFKNSEDYKNYAEDALPIMLERKALERELKYLAID